MCLDEQAAYKEYILEYILESSKMLKLETCIVLRHFV